MNDNQTPLTFERLGIALGVFLILFGIPFGFYVYETVFTKTITVTEPVTLSPGDSLPGTYDSTTYTGPVNDQGSILVFREYEQGSSGKDVNLPFSEGQALPFDMQFDETLVFDSYADGKLTVAYTHEKDVPRPKDERSFSNLTDPLTRPSSDTKQSD